MIVGVLLICAASVSPAACDETTARQVLVAGRYDDGAAIRCQQHLQESIALSALAPRADEYLRSECRRMTGAPRAPGNKPKS